FQGVAITDDLEMAPIRDTWGVGPAAVRAVAAGNDLVTIAHSPLLAEEARQAIAARAAEDSVFLARVREANERVSILRRSYEYLRPLEIDSSYQRELLAEVRRRGPRSGAAQRDP